MAWWPLRRSRADHATPIDVDALIAEKLAERRQALAASGYIADGAPIAEGALGLALSGGGIRSATFSLGVIQALAKHRRLLDFDYLSTVSGGGYIGSFLTSLFLPDAARRASPGKLEKPGSMVLAEKRAFAEQVLNDPACAHLTAASGAPAGETQPIRQPIWWLREHGRYLAPNGTTDFLRAAFYMIRNWLAMLYVFALPIMIFFLFVTAGGWWLLGHLLSESSRHMIEGWFHLGGGDIPICHCNVASKEPGAIYVISPILFFAAPAIFLSFAAGLAYWLTEELKIGLVWKSGRSLLSRWPLLKTIALIGGVGGGGAVAILVGPMLHFAPNTFARVLIRLGEGLTLVASVIAIGGAGRIWLKRFPKSVTEPSGTITVKLRASLTALGARSMAVSMIILVLGIIDTAALAIHDHLLELIKQHLSISAMSTAIMPAGAWVINRLASGTADRGKGKKSLFAYLPMIALFAGIILFGLFAILIDTVLHTMLWSTPVSWPMGFALSAAIDQRFAGLLLACGVGLMAITGGLTGFINLSSLHNLYASRLTRAYLGASNRWRLSSAKPITDDDPADYIDFARYQRFASAAPLHLVNVTLNETHSRDGSNVVDRDRKGVPLVFGPEGIFVDAAHPPRPLGGAKQGQPVFYDWGQLREGGVEALSVGQLCAISGAAASSGMGARTTLGTALALTFANIRLGYWWNVGTLLRSHRPILQRFLSRLRLRVAKPLRTYRYLLNEMLGRYSRDYGCVYLSDGGHFENSAAYELLRRGVKAILVCDNGADPDYAFEDLENLIRKARIDLCLELSVASAESVAALYGPAGAELFMNGGSRPWRKAARDKRSKAFVLLIDVLHRQEAAAEPSLAGRILWLKPAIVSELPEDVAGYALANAPFPQQTTADQFFDEAQWESYRMLGFTLMNRLLTDTLPGKDCVRSALP